MDDREIIIPRTCTDCGKLQKFKVKLSDYNRWKEGELIQNAFPYLSNEDREMLISKTCNDCFDNLFGEDF